VYLAIEGERARAQALRYLINMRTGDKVSARMRVSEDSLAR